jgi:hypothetical protein
MLHVKHSPPPPNSDDAWLSPWLNWLDKVEEASNIRDFGEGDTLDQLHAMWKRGASTDEAARWLSDI